MDTPPEVEMCYLPTKHHFSGAKNCWVLEVHLHRIDVLITSRSEGDEFTLNVDMFHASLV